MVRELDTISGSAFPAVLFIGREDHPSLPIIESDFEPFQEVRADNSGEGDPVPLELSEIESHEGENVGNSDLPQGQGLHLGHIPSDLEAQFFGDLPVDECQSARIQDKRI
jgi:hypothetical protein